MFNKKFISLFLAALAVAGLGLGFSERSVSASVISIERAAVTNGWVRKGNNWYYYTNGSKTVGWKRINYIWYYFEADGTMVTGWKELSVSGFPQKRWFYFTSSGKMVTEWQMIDGKWYYFDRVVGYMYSNTVLMISGEKYHFGSTGAMKSSEWYSDAGIWYYFDSNGKAVSGFQWIDGKKYYFDEETRIMESGCYVKVDGKYYRCRDDGSLYINEWAVSSAGHEEHYDADGVKAKGWTEADGETYYIGDWGLHHGKSLIDGEYYLFHEDGRLAHGWIYIDSISDDEKGWYFANRNGQVQTGWIKYNNDWYYIKPDTEKMYNNGILEIDYVTYCFGDDGKLLVNKWYQDGRDWLYFGSDGAVYSGWLKYNNNWYYLHGVYDLPHLITGSTFEYKGATYRVDGSGRMVTGWYEEGPGGWAYFGSDGKQYISRWLNYKNNWYYFEDDGIIAHGPTEVNGVMYLFGSDGKMKTGWNEYRDDVYYCYSDGRMAINTWVEGYYFGSDGKCVK